MKFFTLLLCLVACCSNAELKHLRGGGDSREWHTFPAESPGDALRMTLPGLVVDEAACLTIRQVDVRHNWTVTLNGEKLGRLQGEEDDLVQLFKVRPQLISKEENVLEITFDKGRDVDDIYLGAARLHAQSETAFRSAATLDVSVVEDGKPIPARITLVDENGSLMPLGLRSSDQVAVRSGVVYTLDGLASIPCPAGSYTVYASHGFEYSLAKTSVKLEAGQPKSVELALVHEVPTPGLISCDPHVHTVTYSRHGDCTLTERMITLAGEHIEVPVATDHNLHIDYTKERARLGIQYFTPVTGNEYTTSTGHFNLFPVDPESKPPSYIGEDWSKVMEAIKQMGADVAILNHARDIHRNFRPFDPAIHIAVTGESTQGRDYAFNAMEVLNSGAIINDPLLLIRDWFGLLNRGLPVAAIGSSDSHDVSNYIVGQGRTYVPTIDQNPGALDIGSVVQAIRDGQTHVSYGLLAQLEAKQQDQYIELKVKVTGPRWIPGGDVRLFMNGIEVFKSEAAAEGVVKFERTLRWPNPGHDVWFAAVATSPGTKENYWPCSSPYQRLNDVHDAYFLGVSPAVRVDADANGEFSSAYAYAQELGRAHPEAPAAAIAACARYDAAVAAQLASVLVHSGVPAKDIHSDVAMVQKGLRQFLAAWDFAQSAEPKDPLFPNK